MSQNLLENISAVEISTVIVAEIVDEVFIPWSAYQGIYQLNRSYLEQSGIDLSLHHRYLQLRRQLELAYCLLLIDPNSQLYNRTLVREIKRDLPILSQQNSDWSTLTTRLPEPIPQRRHETMSLVNKLLSEPQLINILQQLDKLKAALDRRDRILRESHHNSITDITFAQTSLQLNGKIINRYSEAILERSDRNLLLQLHQQSTTTGEKQWRGLINFMLSVIAKP